MKKRIIYAFVMLVSASFLLFVSCKKDKTENAVPTGTVKGKVYAQNGTTPIPMVMVFVDANGEVYMTLTDIHGDFNLEVPTGNQQLCIESGRGNIFRSVFSVYVPENGTVNLPDGTLKLQQTANLAYIPGAYDNIETIIIDSLGYAATQLAVADLDNLTNLETYAGLFLNCGKYGALDSLKYANLLAFVNNGGSIYASDYAVEYLTGDGNYKGTQSHSNVGTMTKSCVYDLGGFIADSLLCTEKVGPGGYVYGANILPADLQTYMGITQIDILYDLSAWEEIKELAAPPWEVLIEDPGGYGPLAIRWTLPGNSKAMEQVLDQGWITICHIPPGNPQNAHTITISINALPAHLAHGDYIGPCVGNGGTIYFTTFHNEPQGNLSSDMQKMLEYFILNL